MSVSQPTNQFMKALPAALRPNPYNVEEAVMEALQNGWDAQSLAQACYANERNPTPAFVVTNLRNLCKYGPKREPLRKPWEYGHIRCGELSHGPTCEICRCIPGQVTHHTACPPSKETGSAYRRLTN